MAGVVLADLGKRGRESSAEQWRELARTVPGTLLRVATSESEAVLSCVESTHQRFRTLTAANLLQTYRAARHGNRSRRPPGPTTLREVERLAALHDAAGHVFALCAASLGLTRERRDGDYAEALWRAWDGHRAEAARHASEAQRRLRSVLAALHATLRVLFVVSRRPPESPPRVAWASEAEELLRHAEREAAAASDAVLRMRHAVFLEFFDAWMVLTRLDARAGEQPT